VTSKKGEIMVIKNSNRNEYKILESKGKYLLLENVTPKSLGNKYVCAYNFANGTWQQGNYFDDFTDAKACFDEKRI